MKKIKILSVFGTRPEAIKMAPVVKELMQTTAVQSIVCVTAQHREMLDQVLGLFNIIPDIDLDIMRSNQTLPELTAKIFTDLDPVFDYVNPDWMLIQGDTTTVMAASILAFYRNIKVGHVEAGLRTNDKLQPFPEEINRRIASVVADLHFAPTEWSRQNLIRDGISPTSIFVTGNPVIDALHHVSNLPPPKETKELLEKLNIGKGNRLILVTAHRRENFGKPLEDICYGLRRIAEHYKNEIQIVYPVHLNPNVQKIVYPALAEVPNITLLPPIEYLPLVHLLKNATLVLTDSGGIQEEAPSFGIPVLVMRDVTERPEGVEAGTLRVVGTDSDYILNETIRLLDDSHYYSSMAKAVNPFGDGHSAEKIVNALLYYSNNLQQS